MMGKYERNRGRGWWRGMDYGVVANMNFMCTTRETGAEGGGGAMDCGVVVKGAGKK